MKAPPMTERPEIGPAANGLTYRDSGVDIEAGDALVERIKPLARATTRAGVLGGLGGFGAIFDLKAAGFVDPVLVSTTDGVGTKLKLAIETARHDTVGIDLVAMCVNDLVVQGAEPLFFLDYFATGALSVEHAASVVAGIAQGCTEAGCALVGGETAEMPGMYAPGDYDLAGFSVGAAERGHLLPQDVRPGDTVLGLPSSGVHSNGYSLVRRILTTAGAHWDDPAPFASGTLADALMAPTRIYVRPMLSLHRAGLLLAPPTSRAAACPAISRVPCRRAATPNSTQATGPSRPCSAGWRGPAAFPSPRCCACSTVASAWRSSSEMPPPPSPTLPPRINPPPSSATSSQVKASPRPASPSRTAG